MLQKNISIVFTLGGTGGLSKRGGGRGDGKRVCSCGSRGKSDRASGIGRILSVGYMGGADGS